MRVAFLYVLLPLVQGALVGITIGTSVPPEIDTVDPSTGQFKKIVALPSGSVTSGVLQSNNTMLYGVIDNDEDVSRLNTVDLSTGQVQLGPPHPKLWFCGLGFDKTTSQTFVFAFNMTTWVNNLVFELLPDQTLRQLVEFSGSAMNGGTCSSTKRIFFVAMKREVLTVNYVLAVSTAKGQEGKILYNVSIPLIIRSLMYDDTFGVLYVAGSDGTHYNAVLMSVDYTTGKILKTFLQSAVLNIFGSGCTINPAGTTFYSSMSVASGELVYTLDLRSGNATQAAANGLAVSLSFR